MGPLGIPMDKNERQFASSKGDVERCEYLLVVAELLRFGPRVSFFLACCSFRYV